MRFQKSHMQIHEAYQFLHKKRSAQVTESLTDCMPPATQRNSPSVFAQSMLYNAAAISFTALGGAATKGGGEGEEAAGGGGGGGGSGAEEVADNASWRSRE